MIISENKLKRLIHGVCRFEKHDGYLVPRRFTAEQVKSFENEEVFYIRAKSTSMMEIRLLTDATKISFDYRLEEIVRRKTVDVYVDGVLHTIFSLDGPPDEHRFSCKLPTGEKSVAIYFPCYCCLTLKNFEVNGSARSVRKSRTHVLWIGDSITQGTAMISSLNYVNGIKREFGWDVLDNGIGGVQYDTRLATPIPSFRPSKILVALGTNGCGSPEFKERAESFYSALTALYPDIPITVITPLWRPDESYRYLKPNENIVREICAKYTNIRFIDGFTLVPNVKEFYNDNVHPNDLGMTYYATNLAKALKK